MGLEARGPAASRGRTCVATAPCWLMGGAQPAVHSLVFYLPPAPPPRPPSPCIPFFVFPHDRSGLGPRGQAAWATRYYPRALHTLWDPGTLSLVRMRNPRYRVGWALPQVTARRALPNLAFPAPKAMGPGLRVEPGEGPGGVGGWGECRGAGPRQKVLGPESLRTVLGRIPGWWPHEPAHQACLVTGVR